MALDLILLQKKEEEKVDVIEELLKEGRGR